MDATETRDAWLKPAQVAAMFGVETRTLINWVHAERLKAQRTVGGQRRYRESDVRALLAELVSPGRPDAATPAEAAA